MMPVDEIQIHIPTQQAILYSSVLLIIWAVWSNKKAQRRAGHYLMMAALGIVALWWYVQTGGKA
jgi:uncharacterized membrane protein YqjE